MSERWVDIPEFPDYEISDHGNVFSKRTQTNIQPSWNGTGSVKVMFSIEGVPHTRSVRVMVANAFLAVPDDDYTSSFDLEVINIDGDMWNNHVDNLAWRPHWFVWKYTRQFRDGPVQEYNVPIFNTQTGILYDNIMDAGVADAVLWEYVYASAINGKPVYPTGAVYDFVAPGTVSQLKHRL